MNTYESRTSSYQSHLRASRMLQDAGLEVVPQDTVNLRGPRQGCGYGPVGDTNLYRFDVRAENFEAIKAAIPGDTFVDITFCNAETHKTEGYLSHSMCLRGEWRQ